MAISLQDVGRETGQGTSDVSLGAVSDQANNLGAFRVAGTPIIDIPVEEPLNQGTGYSFSLDFPTEGAGWLDAISDNDNGFFFTFDGNGTRGNQVGRLCFYTPGSENFLIVEVTFQDGVNKDHPDYETTITRIIDVE